MRRILILIIWTTVLSGTAHAAYEEIRELNLPIGSITTLEIDAGAGGLEIVGVEGLENIMVTATIYVPGRNDDKARKKIQKKMVLTLTHDGGMATLEAHFGKSIWGFSNRKAVNLAVRVPEHINLAIVDGIGSMEIEKVRGNLTIDDGVGHIMMDDVGGNVEITDGTGAINVSGVGGDISVSDGTGEIVIDGVVGSVEIDDGAGGVDYSNIQGRIED